MKNISLKYLIAGIDEAGRGPWAGPVVAAAVILRHPLSPDALALFRDSKTLSAKKRQAAIALLKREDHHFGIGAASRREIDRINILQATLLAMQRAVAHLPQPPDHAIIDGRDAPRLDCSTATFIKGDARYPEISAASIIAKETRDWIMRALHHRYPVFGWDRNSGYGTALHRQGLQNNGPTAHHRYSFRPIAALKPR